MVHSTVRALRTVWTLFSGLLLSGYVLQTASEDGVMHPREYTQGAYCEDGRTVFDPSVAGDDFLECMDGEPMLGSQIGCHRTLNCLNIDRPDRKDDGCQSDYITAIYPGGINSQESCIKYCEEVRPELKVVTYRKDKTDGSSKICCACSSRGYPGQYCHSDLRCVIGASFCCEGNPATSIMCARPLFTFIIMIVAMALTA